MEDLLICGLVVRTVLYQVKRFHCSRSVYVLGQNQVRVKKNLLYFSFQYPFSLNPIINMLYIINYCYNYYYFYYYLGLKVKETEPIKLH